MSERERRMREAMDNAPKKPVENSEERFDNEVMPLIEEAHLKAMSLGIPIYTHAMITDDWVTSTVASAPGGIKSMPITSVVAYLIAEAKHPAARDMLLSAVKASKDSFLAGLMIKAIARAMEGGEHGEIFSAVAQVVDIMEDRDESEGPDMDGNDLLDSLLSD